MKLKFSLKLSLFVILAATHCFSVTHSATYSAASVSSSGIDLAENAKVLVGMQYITGQHTKRCGDFNEKPIETSAKSAQTDNIIQVLSNPAKVSAQKADETQTRVIATSIMTTIFVHNGAKKLTRNNLKETDIHYRHFRATELIEDLSVLLNGNLEANGYKALDEAVLTSNWSTYSDLETYSKITKELFALWFNEALREHRGGFVKLIAIAEIKKQAEIAEQKIKDAIAEQLRQDKIKAAAAAEEAKQKLRLLKLEEETARKAEEKRQADELRAKEEQAAEAARLLKLKEEKRRQAEIVGSPRGPINMRTIMHGGNDGSQTPQNLFKRKGRDAQTPSTRVKARVNRENAPHENGGTLDALIGGKKLEFQYFRISDDLNDKNYLGLGMTRTDFESRIKSARIEDVADIYREMLESEKESATEDSKDSEMETKAAVTEAKIMEAFANYYLGSGQLELASKLLTETSICIWEHKNENCVLKHIYSDGKILSDGVQISSIEAKIRNLDTSLIHLYLTTDNFYDSLQLANVSTSSSSNLAVARTSYFSNFAMFVSNVYAQWEKPTFRRSLFGAVSAAGLGVSAFFFPGTWSALLKGFGKKS